MILDVSPRESCVFLVFIAALLTAWNANANGFVWDDRSAVLHNLDAQSSSLWDVFSHDFWGADIQSVHSHKSYRPLTILSFRLNFWMGKGHSAWLYHFTNALVHATCSVLVWKVADVLFQQHQRRIGSVSNKENPQDSSPTAASEKQEVTSGESWENLVGSLTTGLLFAVHPIHCDAVASIVGRADLLCTSLSLTAFLAYVEGAKKKKTKWASIALALGLTIAAGLCKELGFTNFALLVAYDVLRIHHYQANMKAMQLMVRRVTITVTVGVLAAFVRVWINGEHQQMEWNILANNVVVQESRLTRILSYMHLHVWYLWKLVWPRWLCFDYGYNTIPVIESISDPRNVYTLFGYLVVATGLHSATLHWFGSRKSPPSSLLVLCIAFGVVPFVPASNIIFPVGTVVAERLMYFPSIGFCLLIGCALDQTFSTMHKYTQAAPLDAKHHQVPSLHHPKRLFGVARVVTLSCGAVILATGCYRSHLRNADWIDEQTLFKAAVEVVPTNVKVLSNEAKNQLGPDPMKALDYLRISIGMIPKHIESHLNAGLAFVTLAARSEMDNQLYLHGIRHLYKSAMLTPDLFVAPGYVGGEIYAHWLKSHRFKGDDTIENFLGSKSISHAVKFLDRALELESNYPSHFYNRGSVAYDTGDFDTAIKYFRTTEVANGIIRDRKVDPELLVKASSIYNMLGVCFKRKGEVEKALDMLRKGIALYPEDTDLHINAVLTLLDLDNTEEAAEQLQTGLAAATTLEHAERLRNTAQRLASSVIPEIVETILDRATELELEHTSSS
ncbi:Transmembrane and TPR repeat-containing protein 4 [Phytophthora citrophthora]|uniref:dolichyl-phosphate-mannose--protein mannosyltransferase n=1 Tax=Phytophthora citrophthora TaxID=4793 RepID=A0AAD9LC79_9STRA|nr:Transmembrane and TPR repeat-containing protein 4 [Phytophthora citrophthora]